MVLKAIELGMDEDGQVDEQAKRVANLTAVNAIHEDMMLRTAGKT